VLIIDSVTRQDGGLYVCTADNGAGSKSRDFVVDIQCTFFFVPSNLLLLPLALRPVVRAAVSLLWVRNAPALTDTRPITKS